MPIQYNLDLFTSENFTYKSQINKMKNTDCINFLEEMEKIFLGKCKDDPLFRKNIFLKEETDKIDTFNFLIKILLYNNQSNQTYFSNDNIIFPKRFGENLNCLTGMLSDKHLIIQESVNLNDTKLVEGESSLEVERKSLGFMSSPSYSLKKKRKSKKITACPHVLKNHYAKNMCDNCYHCRGRKKRPWNCVHQDKFHYALGLCQNCYQKWYCKSKF